MEYCIYSDESDLIGRKYSNFYGGVIIKSKHIKEVEDALNKICVTNNINSEVKWRNLTSNYIDKYKDFVNCFFDFLEDKREIAKVRIMFTDNRFPPTNLTDEQKENGYHLLYYQFIKNAFGIKHCAYHEPPKTLRFKIDNRPTTKEKRIEFIKYINNIPEINEFKHLKITIPTKGISFVESHKHRISQALDIVLGAMSYRLNGKHLEKPQGARIRGNTTLAKEKLYKHIKDRIWRIRPNFNIGASTGYISLEDLWKDPYRHWVFIPIEYKTKSPLLPT